jgi:hypothetical protein
MPKHSQLRPLWSGASSNWHCHTSEIVAVCCMVSAVGPLGGVKPKQRALASGFIKHVHLFSHCWFYYRVMVLLVLGCSSFFRCYSCCDVMLVVSAAAVVVVVVVVAPAVVFEPRNMWPRSVKSELKPSMADQPWKIDENPYQMVNEPAQFLHSHHVVPRQTGTHKPSANLGRSQSGANFGSRSTSSNA